MIVPFSLSLAGNETHFPYKIWNGLLQYNVSTMTECSAYQAKHLTKLNIHWSEPNHTLFEEQIKVHTIRQDLTNRYKVGCKLHLFIHARTKNMFRFAPILECTAIQEIKITYNESGIPSVFIDGKMLYCFDVKRLAKNDGFNSTEEFFAYFNSDFYGKIIHWTSVRY